MSRPRHLTWWQWWLHRLGACPKRALGYYCRGTQAANRSLECGWGRRL